MKKVKTFVMVFICGFMIVSLTGCINKQAITSENFKIKMESRGFEVQDVTYQFEDLSYKSEYYSYMNKALLASNNKYQIIFYETKDTHLAESIYNKSVKDFKRDGKSVKYTSVNFGNHAKYTLINDDIYSTVSGIDNTIIYLSNVNIEHKSEIEDILEELGY